MNSRNNKLGKKVNLVLIFFPDCPNYLKVKEALDSLGMPYELANQSLLPSNSEFLSYCSPTVLVNDKIVLGEPTNKNTQGCSILPKTFSEIKELLKSRILTQFGETPSQT